MVGNVTSGRRVKRNGRTVGGCGELPPAGAPPRIRPTGLVVRGAHAAAREDDLVDRVPLLPQLRRHLGPVLLQLSASGFTCIPFTGAPSYALSMRSTSMARRAHGYGRSAGGREGGASSVCARRVRSGAARLRVTPSVGSVVRHRHPRHCQLNNNKLNKGGGIFNNRLTDLPKCQLSI